LYQVNHDKWLAYQSQLQVREHKEKQFEKWVAEKQIEYDTFCKEWNELSIDSSKVIELESIVVQHEQFISYENKKKDVSILREQFEQWLHLQLERYQHWKEEQETLHIDVTLKNQYEGYIQQQEQYNIHQ